MVGDQRRINNLTHSGRKFKQVPFGFIPGEKFVLLSCEEEERLASVRCKGIPLALWSNRCSESTGALVEKFIKVDEANVGREVLEFVRLCFSVPVEIRLTFSHIKRGVFSESESEARSEYGVRGEFLDSECSDFGERVGAEGGEEKIVPFPGLLEEIPIVDARVRGVVNAPLERQTGASVLKEIVFCFEEHVNSINKRHAKELSSFNKTLAFARISVNDEHAKMRSKVNEAHTLCQLDIIEGTSVLQMDWAECVGLPLTHLREAGRVGTSVDSSLDVAGRSSVRAAGDSEGSLGHAASMVGEGPIAEAMNRPVRAANVKRKEPGAGSEGEESPP
ncbi:hypothetical protein VNO80_19257 [Phaseolus coccineus]|uniref:Uncharacterized protein n=1 Tax=Phaseolus coccineus TaxID=3886 RepID=A0AAN9MFB0_PHACN